MLKNITLLTCIHSVSLKGKFSLHLIDCFLIAKLVHVMFQFPVIIIYNLACLSPASVTQIY